MAKNQSVDAASPPRLKPTRPTNSKSSRQDSLGLGQISFGLGPAPICNRMSSIGYDDMPSLELASPTAVPGTAAGWSADSALKLCGPSNAH
jgi:hypothetical protein